MRYWTACSIAGHGRGSTVRIQARAIRRCGELLKTFDGRGRPPENNNGAVVISQTKAAEDAGLSQRQKETAVRVANVPDEDFEAAVESDNPPTVTELAEQGKKTQLVDLVRGTCRGWMAPRDDNDRNASRSRQKGKTEYLINPAVNSDRAQKTLKGATPLPDIPDTLAKLGTMSGLSGSNPAPLAKKTGSLEVSGG